MFYILLCAFSIFSFAFAEELVVGTTSGYAPYVSLNVNGDYEGFDIDMANAIAGKLDRKLVIKDFGSMPALMLALKQNKADALMWAIAITPERQEKLAMIYYQGEKVTTMSLLFWGEIPENIKGLKDMTGSVISVEAGSFQENALLSQPGLSLKQVEKVSDAILELKYGKSKAVCIDQSIKFLFMKKFPELQSLTINLPESKQTLGNGICLNLNNVELARAIQKAVDELSSDGTIAKLEVKWKLEEQ